MSGVKKIKLIIRLIRAYQWTKSGFIFLPLVFSPYLHAIIGAPFSDAAIFALSHLLKTFLAFSFMASSIYIINDWKDVELDRLDARKQKRPLASGAISLTLAMAVAALLFIMSTALAYLANTAVLAVVLSYFFMNLLYSYVLKHVVLVDVFIIAIGFVLRVLIGSFALEIEPSPWLMSCTFFLALFLGFFKRYYEVKVGPAEKMYGGRYHPDSLKNFINITSSLAIMSYSVYTLTGVHSEANLFWTIPLVVLGIFRYYTLLESPEEIQDGNPSDILLADRFLMITIGLWVILCAVLILHFEPPPPV